jgi:Leucine-rich repeat (LRR) protein
VNTTATATSVTSIILACILTGCSHREAPHSDARPTGAAESTAELSLTGKNITELSVIPLRQVRVLRLACNESLHQLPLSLATLPTLEVLDIDNGNACEMHLVLSNSGQFPPSLRVLNLSGALDESSPLPLENLKLLKELDISRYHRRVVPADVFFLTSLRLLRLDFMGLTSMSTRVAELKDLEELYVQGNRIPAAAWPDLTGLSKLRILDVSNNEYTEADLQLIRSKMPASAKILFANNEAK